MYRFCGAAVVAFLLVVCAACGAGGVRPTFQVFPQAITDTIDAGPEAIVEQLAEVIAEEGIELRWVRVREGYVETRWFDAVSGRTGGGRSLNTDAIVRMRFWTDLVTEHQSVVVGEAVQRRIIDPSLPEREQEVHVTPEHPGFATLQRILAALATHIRGDEH